jgi:2-polyprenyl-6-methoxyphenol hydroxylase-like FAD-dependent oxidoreductase
MFTIGMTDTPRSGGRPALRSEVATVPALVVGAGPVGLTLCLELNRHGIETLLVERNPSTTRHPKMDITNDRSMELFRQLGVADQLRKAGIAAHRRTKVTWATSGLGWELASFEYPSVDEQDAINRETNDGTLAVEPAMRVSQVVLEPALRDLLIERAEHVTVEYGWALEDYTEDAEGVTADLVQFETGARRTVRTQYLLGTDGAGSVVRSKLGIGIEEIDLRKEILAKLGLPRVASALLRGFLERRQTPPSGGFYLVHFTTSDRRMVERFGHVWHLQSPDGWALINQDDADIWTMHTPFGVGFDVNAVDPREFVYEQLGFRFEMDVILHNAWTPRLTVADSFGRGRVWLAGDSTHQVTPAGGYGMNTGVGDAIGLGWAVAAQIQGWGEPGLLDAYELERRPVALRNRAASARHSVVRAAIMSRARRAMHSEDWKGDRVRRRIGREIADLGNLENEADGIELGYRYDASPVICHEDGDAPVQRMDEYTPSTWPGARPPHVRLADGRAIFDLLGTEFTLLRFDDVDVAGLVSAAEARGVQLEVVDVRDPHARHLYERDLVLLRPDQHVAWRGDVAPASPLAVIDRVRGATT